MSICEPRSRFSPDTTSASALIWDFQPPDYEKPISAVSNHPVWNSVIIAARDDEDREPGWGEGVGRQRKRHPHQGLQTRETGGPGSEWAPRASAHTKWMPHEYLPFAWIISLLSSLPEKGLEVL